VKSNTNSRTRSVTFSTFDAATVKLSMWLSAWTGRLLTHVHNQPLATPAGMRLEMLRVHDIPQDGMPSQMPVLEPKGFDVCVKWAKVSWKCLSGSSCLLMPLILKPRCIVWEMWTACRRMFSVGRSWGWWQPGAWHFWQVGKHVTASDVAPSMPVEAGAGLILIKSIGKVLSTRR
jgi:hypothetical protein